MGKHWNLKIGPDGKWKMENEKCEFTYLEKSTLSKSEIIH
jgi:hypothetical protein